jgi:hypothetical protein
MMEAARTSETPVYNYFTRQYIPEDKSELLIGCPDGKISLVGSRRKWEFNIIFFIKYVWFGGDKCIKF